MQRRTTVRLSLGDDEGEALESVGPPVDDVAVLSWNIVEASHLPRGDRITRAVVRLFRRLLETRRGQYGGREWHVRQRRLPCAGHGGQCDQQRPTSNGNAHDLSPPPGADCRRPTIRRFSSRPHAALSGGPPVAGGSAATAG